MGLFSRKIKNCPAMSFWVGSWLVSVKFSWTKNFFCLKHFHGNSNVHSCKMQVKHLFNSLSHLSLSDIWPIVGPSFILCSPKTMWIFSSMLASVFMRAFFCRCADLMQWAAVSIQVSPTRLPPHTWPSTWHTMHQHYATFKHHHQHQYHTPSPAPCTITSTMHHAPSPAPVHQRPAVLRPSRARRRAGGEILKCCLVDKNTQSQLPNDGILKNSCCIIPFQIKCISKWILEAAKPKSSN